MANLITPEALKAVKPYLTLASQLEQKNEKAVAYYCRAYACQNAMTINKTLPECKKFLAQIMDSLEATKAQHQNDDAIKSEMVGQTYVEEFALKIFDKADSEDRQANFNKNLVKQFYSAGLVFDCLNYFGELSEDLVAKKQYAKRKAMYLNKCFQTGEKPIPGPLTSEGDNNDEFANYDSGTTDAGYTPVQPNAPPSGAVNKYPVLPDISYNNASNSNAQYFQDTTQTSASGLSADAMQKAQKLVKYAASALQYEDVPTAISNLEQCLNLLKSGK